MSPTSARELVAAALFLRAYGDNAPGYKGRDLQTWAEWDRAAEELIRSSDNTGTTFEDMGKIVFVADGKEYFPGRADPGKGRVHLALLEDRGLEYHQLRGKYGDDKW